MPTLSVGTIVTIAFVLWCVRPSLAKGALVFVTLLGRACFVSRQALLGYVERQDSGETEESEAS